VLGEHGVDYEAREFFKEALTRDELAAILERAGMSPSKLVSTRSAVYRSEGLGDRDLSDDEWIERMLAEPRLLRRPILVTDDGVEIGFNRDRYEQIATRLAPDRA
jgi:Spx/MgsR family transcriptional regulator